MVFSLQYNYLKQPVPILSLGRKRVPLCRASRLRCYRSLEGQNSPENRKYVREFQCKDM